MPVAEVAIKKPKEVVGAAVLKVLILEKTQALRLPDPSLYNDENLSKDKKRATFERVIELEDALELLERQAFDIILLDLPVTVDAGLNDLKRLLAARCCTPIIVLTDSENHPTALKALEAGAYDYWIKREINVSSLVRNLHLLHERAQAGYALKQSESKQRHLLNAIPDLLLQYAADGTYLGYHASTWEHLHTEPDNFIGKRIADVLPPEAAELTQRNLTRCLTEGKARFKYNLEVKNGFKTYEAHMVRTEENTVLSFIRDISKYEKGNENLRKQNIFLTALHETTLGIMNRLELSELFDSLVKHATHLTGAPRGFVFLVNEAENKLEIASNAGFTEFKNMKVGFGEGASGRVWATGEAVFINNYDNPQLIKNKAGIIKSIAATPLKSDGKVRGVLGVFSHTAHQPLNKDSLDILNSFAKLASIALDNARLYDEAQREIETRAQQTRTLQEGEARYRELFIASKRQARDLELLDQVRNLVTQQRDLKTLLKTVVDTVAQLFGYDQICLALIRDNELQPQYYLGYDVELPAIPLSQGVSGRVARTGRPELVLDAAQDSDYISVSPDISSEICTPLFDKGKPIGVINIETTQANPLSEADLQIMTALSAQVSIAIENARLYEQVKNDLKRTKALQQISQAIALADSSQTLLQTVAHNILDAVAAQQISIYILDAAQRRNKVASASKALNRALEPGTLEDLNAQALRDGKALVCARTPRDQSSNEASASPKDLSGSLIVAPLLYGRKRLGTINVARCATEPDFSQKDVTLIESIASQLVIALEQRQLLEQIEHQAYHDTLTGLPNRLMFENRLENSIARSKRSDKPFALLFIDLDGFKNVNDTLGHPVGDKLLKAVAERLQGEMRGGDTLARMGGDEFAFVLNDLKLPYSPDAVRIGKRYLDLFKAPFVVENHELFVTASMGMCLYPDDGQDAETLLRHSDSAMYSAKHLGKNDIQTFTPDLADKARKRLTLGNQLRRALEREELELHYQPQINLRSGAWVGTEALIRWRHKGQLVSPADFIPIAEESNLIVPIGEWVLHEACRQNVQWQQAGRPPMRVAVNISPRQFSRPNFVETVKSALASSGLAPQYLELEVTEGVVMHDIGVVAQRLQQLRDLGVSIAIDDFGTGYSSLQYLQRLPIDSLKIDRSFISAIHFEGGEETSALVQIIITMAQTFGLNVVAEGVETEVQLEYLRSLNCQQAQGYYFAKPLPASELWQTQKPEKVKVAWHQTSESSVKNSQ